MAGLPLSGRTILVTRRPEQASELREGLVARGATVLEVPTLEVVPPADVSALDRSLRQLNRYHWILFTSANAVRFVADRMQELGLGPGALDGLRVGSVGPSTTAVLQERFPGRRIEAQPESDFRAEGLLAVLGDVSGQVILFPASDKARDVLPSTLEARGAKVDVVVAYRTVAPPDLAERLEASLERGFDLVTFASPSAVEGFAKALGPRSAGVRAAVIGPVTEQAARAAGLDVRVVASPSTAEGLLDAMVSLFRAG
jgi:uroporphyrinogen III methyltransferase/synthase